MYCYSYFFYDYFLFFIFFYQCFWFCITMGKHNDLFHVRCCDYVHRKIICVNYIECSVKIECKIKCVLKCTCTDNFLSGFQIWCGKTQIHTGTLGCRDNCTMPIEFCARFLLIRIGPIHTTHWKSYSSLSNGTTHRGLTFHHARSEQQEGD